jgi:hypothetical protein
MFTKLEDQGYYFKKNVYHDFNDKIANPKLFKIFNKFNINPKINTLKDYNKIHHNNWYMLESLNCHYYLGIFTKNDSFLSCYPTFHHQIKSINKTQLRNLTFTNLKYLKANRGDIILIDKHLPLYSFNNVVWFKVDNKHFIENKNKFKMISKYIEEEGKGYVKTIDNICYIRLKENYKNPTNNYLTLQLNNCHPYLIDDLQINDLSELGKTKLLDYLNNIIYNMSHFDAFNFYCNNTLSKIIETLVKIDNTTSKPHSIEFHKKISNKNVKYYVSEWANEINTVKYIIVKEGPHGYIKMKGELNSIMSIINRIKLLNL